MSDFDNELHYALDPEMTEEDWAAWAEYAKLERRYRELKDKDVQS